MHHPELVPFLVVSGLSSPVAAAPPAPDQSKPATAATIAANKKVLGTLPGSTGLRGRTARARRPARRARGDANIAGNQEALGDLLDNIATP